MEPITKKYLISNIENSFIIEDKIGEGGYAQVYKTTKKSTGEKYALKIIAKAKAGNTLKYLTNEIEFMMNIDHPNVVKVYEYYEDEKNIYLVMELMLGGELYSRIVSKSQYNERDALVIIKQIVDGILFCHSKGIVHRDIKPENILFHTPDEHSNIKITDFGISRHFDYNNPMTSQVGSLMYLAPEIIKAKGYDEKVDFWSLGIVSFILLCGYHPFYSDNDIQMMKQITKGKLEFISPNCDNLSEEAKDFLTLLLVVDPEERLSGPQVLLHPWLKNQSPSLIELVETVQDIKKFKASSKNK